MAKEATMRALIEVVIMVLLTFLVIIGSYYVASAGEEWLEQQMTAMGVAAEKAANLAGGFIATIWITSLLMIVYFFTEKQRTGNASLRPESYSQRLRSLMKNLTKASSQVDNILVELAKVAEEREKAIRELETGLGKLEEREKTLQKRVEELENVPIPVADYFAELVDRGEKRSAMRDYLLFLAGVVVSAVLSVILG
jgi:hypothetical protein